MKVIVNLVLFVLVVFAFISCAKDLPQSDPETEIARAIVKAQAAEARAKAALEAAKVERQKAETLMKEAKHLSEKNRKACEIRCKEERAKRIKIREKKQTQNRAQNSKKSAFDYPPGTRLATVSV